MLQSAEAWRRAIAREWLGEELPPSVGQTTVNVSFSDDRDAGLTWANAGRRPGSHTLYLTTTPAQALGPTLAHEMVHVVLATRFPDPARLPAWLEEGVASRYDDCERHAIRHRIVSWMARTGNWADLQVLLARPHIPPHDKAAYAAASSVVEYLLTQGDKPTLLEFGRYGARAGWDAALDRYYRIRGRAELQPRWQAWIAESL